MKFLKKLAPHLFLSLIIFSVLMPVAGVRHLWQDEMETAERARSVLAYGVPKVIDPEGRLSLNSGGREIEDGELHRYTPWGQFYVGAAGLFVGRAIGLSDDASVRMPFVLAHALTSGVLSYGLVAILQWPVVVAAAIAGLFGMQSVRLLSNRTCRYHSLLDLLFLTGLVAIGLRKRFPKTSKFVSAFCVFLLPQIHTLGGSLLASTLVLTALVKPASELKVFSWRALWEIVHDELWPSVIPALASVAVIGILCRPWAQTAWGVVDVTRNWGSLRSTLEIAYSFYITGILILIFLWRREFKIVTAVAILTAWIHLTVKVLDFHPFSQTRYYLSVPIFFLFWLLAWGIPHSLKKYERALWFVLVLGVLLPEIQGIIPKLEGLRILRSDYRMQRDHEEQPLARALKRLESSGGARETVLVEYVPQFANWYLRGASVAMIPEPTGRTKLNSGNPLFQVRRLMPSWHIFYKRQNGFWTCADKCDFHRTDIVDGSYDLVVTSPVEGEQPIMRFCVVDSWPVSRWNNAPFVGYNHASVTPEGPVDDVLFLARKCSK